LQRVRRSTIAGTIGGFLLPILPAHNRRVPVNDRGGLVKRLCVVVHEGDTAPNWDDDYHVLGALLDPTEGIGPDKLALGPVFAADAVAIYLPDTLTGEVTAAWLVERLNERGIRVLAVRPTLETLKTGTFSGW
jgi:hypothetical protein